MNAFVRSILRWLPTEVWIGLGVLLAMMILYAIFKSISECIGDCEVRLPRIVKQAIALVIVFACFLILLAIVDPQHSWFYDPTVLEPWQMIAILLIAAFGVVAGASKLIARAQRKEAEQAGGE